MMAKIVVLGLSDGVDSAVAAYLLKQQGYEVYGLHLDIGNTEDSIIAKENGDYLGIKSEILNIYNELEEKVCRPFAESYLNGSTPSPCIGCNPDVKFAQLLKKADEIGADWVATGHYVRTDGEHLYMGNSECDQSYMLCRLRDDQIKRLLLPLGGYSKKEIRGIAKSIGLAVADKPDSRENCFIKNQNYVDWIRSHYTVGGSGKALFHGEIIGEHEGIYRYTVGQRWKDDYNERRLYISSIDAKANTIELALWEELFHNELDVSNINWQGGVRTEPFRGRVRVRHTRWEQPECTVYPNENGAHIVTDENLRAPAKGQAAALYVGDMLVCGGYIV